MNKIPLQLIKDYCLLGVAYMLLMLAFHFVYFEEFELSKTVAMIMSMQATGLCVTITMCEVIVAYVMHNPFSYTDTLGERMKHFMWVIVMGIPIMAVVIMFANPIIEYGIEHVDYAYTDRDGTFTLKRLRVDLWACIIGGMLIYVGLVALSEIRHKTLVMKELEAINDALQSEHEKQANDNTVEKITLQGESRETLTLNPREIVYVESIANYQNIVYYDGSDIRQKRLRSSLKDLEEMLSKYTFIVHIHRAFLVNINFITQVTGNAAGYKLQLFGTDKILPVSKANVALFKRKIKTN